MSDKVKRWEPDFDGIMCERNGGDYVLASDFDSLHAEVVALRAVEKAARQLDAAVGEIRAWRRAEHLRKNEKHNEFVTLANARAAVDAIPELRARLEER